MSTQNRVLIIAEAGSNWRMGRYERDLHMAKTLIDVAVDAGADVVKFQTYRAETVYVKQAGQVKYLEDSGAFKDIREIFSDLSMPYEMVPELHAYCSKAGIYFLSTPFSKQDFAAVDPFVTMHKIASYEINHVRLLELAAASKKPILLSTGASVEEDIAWAVDFLKAHESGPVTLMQCTLRYPTPVESANLKVIPWLHQRFGLPVGLSDHTRDPIVAPVTAVALGATVIEKHYTLDNRLPGPDHFFAITAEELKQMVRAIRETEQLLGNGNKEIELAEEEMYRFGRRGVQALLDINVGDILREGVNVDILRPGKQSRGAHPKFLSQIEGKQALRPIKAGSGLQPGDWAI